MPECAWPPGDDGLHLARPVTHNPAGIRDRLSDVEFRTVTEQLADSVHHSEKRFDQATSVSFASSWNLDLRYHGVRAEVPLGIV